MIEDHPGLIDVADRVANGESIHWDREADLPPAADEAQLADRAKVLRGLRMLQALAVPVQHASVQATIDPGNGSDQPCDTLAHDSELPTKRLGDFVLVRELGRGGMGVVYEARQVSLNRRVALKILPDGLGFSPESLARFEREARAAAALHHTNIVPIYAIGEDHGHHYYAMELIEGSSLSTILVEVSLARASPATQRLLSTVGIEAPPAVRAAGVGGVASTRDASPLVVTGSDATNSLSMSDSGSRRWFDTVARLVADVADALHHAHTRGIVHRDVKPSNLMLSTDGRLCLTDFGLALMAEETRLTVTGAFLGTPAYMSPEQIASGRMKLDHRTDIYSLGVVLYEMLTLQRAFAGDSREQVLSDILTKEPRSPRRINRRIPAELETICAKAMEKDSGRRYPTAAAFADDLRSHLNHRAITARRAGPVRRLVKWTQRHPSAATAILAAIAITALGGWGAGQLQDSRRASAARALSEAQFLAAQGSSLEALRRSDEALAAAPALTEARLLRARLLIDVHRPREALADADRLLARDANDWAAHLIKAVALRGKGGTDAQAGTSIASHLRVVEARAPATPDAFHLRALAEPDHAKAIVLLDRALELDPAHSDALASRIRHRIALKQYSAAALDAERLKVARPRSTVGRRMLAQVYLDRLDYAGALEEIEAAITHEPAEAENWWTRAEILRRRRTDKTRALEDYAKAVALRPDSALFHASKARAHIVHGEQEAAVAECEAALRLDPAQLGASEDLFLALRRLGRIEQARNAALDLVDRTAGWSDPRDRARALRLVARNLVLLGDFASALPLAELAMTLDPADYDGPLARAQIRRDSGDPKGALADCVAAAQTPIAGPDEMFDRMFKLYDQCGRADLALPDAERLVGIAPEWPHAWEMSAWINDATGRTDKAIEHAQRAVALAPNDAVLLNTAGCMYGRKFMWEEEGDWFTRALALYPDSDASLLNRGGFVFRFLGRIEEGLADLDRADALYPGDESIAWARSIFLAHLGRCAEADKLWGGVEERGLSGSTTYEDRSQVYAISFWPKCREFVNLKRLIEDAKIAVARASEAKLGTAQIALGGAYYRNGRFAEARTALREGLERVVRRMNAIEDNQDENYGRYFLAMASARLGRTAEAREEFRLALDRTRLTHREKDPDLVSLQAEAETLLNSRLALPESGP